MKIAPFLAPGLVCAGLAVAATHSNLAIDAQGNIWRTGQNLTVPLTANAFQKTEAASFCGTQQLSPFVGPTAVGCSHAYVTKQDASGNILYATYLGGGSEDGGIAITTDGQGNAYVTGFTYSSDFPVSPGAVQTKNAGPLTPRLILEALGPFGPEVVTPGGDVFVAKFGPDGTLVYSTLLGGSGSDVPSAIQVDASGSVYVTGTTSSTDFPVTGDAMSHQPQSTTFFARLDAAGATLVYSTYSDATIQSFDVDQAGDVYLTGVESTSGGPGPYVTEVNTTDGTVVYTTFLPSLDAKYVGAGAAIAVNGMGGTWVGVSPAPVASPLLVPSPPVYPLGSSFLLMLAAGGGSVLQEIDVDSAQFSQILEDAVGDAFALGAATGAMPTAATAPLLALPCSTAGGEFAMEVDASGKLAAATYLRQGTGETAVVAGSGQLSVYDAGSGTAVLTDLTDVPALNFGCLQNLASGSVGLGIAPGEIFAMTGTNIGPAQAVGGVAESGRFPTTLGGVQVMIGGNPAPLLLVQSDLIEGVVPFELSSQYPTVQVQYMGQNAPLLEEPNAPNPAMFVINGQAAVLNQDGTVNTPANPAKLGTIISIYATGLGPLATPVPDGEITPPPPAAYDLLLDPPNVWVAGVQANVVWAGSAPDLVAGGAQINVQLPASLPAGTNLAAVPVFLIQPPIFSPAAPISVTE